MFWLDEKKQVIVFTLNGKDSFDKLPTETIGYAIYARGLFVQYATFPDTPRGENHHDTSLFGSASRKVRMPLPHTEQQPSTIGVETHRRSGVKEITIVVEIHRRSGVKGSQYIIYYYCMYT